MIKKDVGHLVRAAVYGANDGIITTFAIVASIAGAQLSPLIVLVLGVANMVADAISMASSDFLGERSERRLMAAEAPKLPVWSTSAVTFGAFVLAGSLPLIPYLLALLGLLASPFAIAIAATAGALFLVGSLRTALTRGRWWTNGLEMLAVGAFAATVAYLLGALVKNLIINGQLFL